MTNNKNFEQELEKFTSQVNDGDHSAFYTKDAGESVNPSKSLTSYKPKDISTLYPRLFFANNTLPTQSLASPGATKYAFYVSDQTGMAELVSSYSQDAPNVSVTGEEILVDIYPLQAGIEYNDQEIKADAMSNRGLIQKKQRNLNESFLRKIDKLVAVGDDSVGLKGFVNAPNVTEYAINAGAGGQTTWASKTASEIIDDFSKTYETMINVSKGVHMIDTIVMPPAQYAIIAGKERPNLSDTVLSFLNKTYPDVEIFTSARLQGAGAGNTDVMIGMEAETDNFAIEISQPYTVAPVNRIGFLYKQQATMRTAGLVVYRPLSIIRAEGI